MATMDLRLQGRRPRNANTRTLRIGSPRRSLAWRSRQPLAVEPHARFFGVVAVRFGHVRSRRGALRAGGFRLTMARMGPQKATMHDVARLAGVSVASVSNYFHQPHKISDQTRGRIRQAMEAAGFVPNAAARTLRTGVNLVVGYLAFELASATTPEIAVSIERRVAGRGMHLL